MAVNTGPIPGENFTSDTKNYPWRQPPEFSDLNDALDFLAKEVTKFKMANGILTMVEMGFPVYKVVGMILTMGVAEGKWTVDYSLLLAGPLCRMIELICVGFGVDYELGIEEDEDSFNTGTFFKEDQKFRTPNGADFKLLEEELPDIKEAAAEGEGGEGKVESLQTEGFMQMSGTQAMQGEETLESENKEQE